MITKVTTVIFERTAVSGEEQGIMVTGYDKKDRKFKILYSEEMIPVTTGVYLFHEVPCIEVEPGKKMANVTLRRHVAPKNVSVIQRKN